MHFKDLHNYPQVAPFSHLTAPMLWFEIVSEKNETETERDEDNPTIYCLFNIQQMMPKLPDELDTRFNFYLNLLPWVNPLGFWTALLLGVCLLVYAITRATLHMSSFTRQTPSLSEGKYARANLLTGSGACGGNQVYNPCEMKLLNDLPVSKKHVIIRDTTGGVEDAYQERRSSAYALELEPALSDAGESSSDEGNDSDTVTLSRNSTTSSSCVEEVEACEDDICIDCFADNTLDVGVDVDADADMYAGAKHKVGSNTSTTVIMLHHSILGAIEIEITNADADDDWCKEVAAKLSNVSEAIVLLLLLSLTSKFTSALNEIH